MLGKTGRHQWNKRPRLKAATTSEEEEDIWLYLQEDHIAGDHEAHGWSFNQTT
jgi:hypothetical protein